MCCACSDKPMGLHENSVPLNSNELSPFPTWKISKPHFQTHPITHWNYQPLTLPISSFIGESISMFDDKICMKPQNAKLQSETQCSRKYQGTLSYQDYMPKIKNLIVKPIKTMVEPDAFAGSFQITGRHWLAEIVHLSSRIWKMATSITNWNMLRHQITPKFSHDSWYTLLQSNTAIRKCIETSHFLIPCWQ